MEHVVDGHVVLASIFALRCPFGFGRRRSLEFDPHLLQNIFRVVFTALAALRSRGTIRVSLDPVIGVLNSVVQGANSLCSAVVQGAVSDWFLEFVQRNGAKKLVVESFQGIDGRCVSVKDLR